MIILAFLKKYWFHISAAAFVFYMLVVAYGKIYQSGYDQADGEWQKKWNKQELKLSESRALAEKEQRELERKWQSKINQVQQDAETQIELLESDLAAANDSASSLHKQAKRLAERASRQCPSASTSSSGTTTESAASVLAELLARVDEVAGELASYSDRSRIAGLACEDAYDSLILDKKEASDWRL